MTVLNGFKDKIVKLRDIKSHIEQCHRNWTQWKCTSIEHADTHCVMRLARRPTKSFLRYGTVLCPAHKPLVNYKVENNTTPMFVTFFNNVKPKARALNLNNFYTYPFDAAPQWKHCTGSRRLHSAQRQWGCYELWIDEVQGINAVAKKIGIIKRILNENIPFSVLSSHTAVPCVGISCTCTVSINPHK
jgi:hypothetical protein